MNKKDEINSISLDDLRKEIDEADAMGFEYLKKRFEIAEKIAKYKTVTGEEVYAPAREQIVISEMKEKFPPNMENPLASIMSAIMRVSRKIQYDILVKEDFDWEELKIIQSASSEIPKHSGICFQGTTGAYSHLAILKSFPDSAPIPGMTFESCVNKLFDKDCDMALLPLENTTAGVVSEVYNLLAEYPIYIVKSIIVPVHHRLVMLPGAKPHELKYVLSHPHALAQCSRYIKNKGLQQIKVDNTAFAVSRLKEINDKSYCAIASESAGTLNELVVLHEDICDTEHNQTRFVLLSREPVITPKADRISIMFNLPHQSGSLVNTLSVFAERGLNLTKIQSRPIPDKPWQYSFWVDLMAPNNSSDVMAALYQLSKELPFFKLLGWYEEKSEVI